MKIPALNQTTTWTAKQMFSAGLDCVGDISVTGEVDALKYPPDSVNNGDYLGAVYPGACRE
ncbi:hypothetical protein [Enterobacter sp. MALB-1]|uniref:hypothetical protein n=1 Tax=Enterobacter sp. MALB-1 TaxID=3153561 RepID=UPI0034DB70B8